eukprot:1777827-Prymnesium_polylepis.1
MSSSTSSPTVGMLAHALALHPSVTRTASAAFFSLDRTRPDDTWSVVALVPTSPLILAFPPNKTLSFQLPFARQPLRFRLSAS